MEPAPQQTFGKYLILERIATGTMAEIFKARLDGIGGFHRFFAIKRVPPALSQDKELVEMLVEEAKIAGLLSHANIVQILDLGKIDDLYYVAMEYVDGRDLGSVLERCREKGITLPVPHSVFIAIEMLKGLEYAHQRQILRGGRPVPLNIIHRDISPPNMLVSFQGEVKLTDFGMARAKIRAARTLSGVQKGRFDYCSPEQTDSQDLDQRSDLFSAGVVLYEMLCGAHPFRQKGDVQTIDAIRATDPPPPSHVNPDVPYGLEQVLMRAMSRDPGERYATASELKGALDEFFHESGFIFSHSTLAAFLKGLFPESKIRRASATQPTNEQETVAYDSSRFPTLGEDTEAPTSLTSEVGVGLPGALLDTSASVGTEELETLLRRMPDTGNTGSFGPTPGPTDDATLIRKRPDPTEEGWGDGQTQVNPLLLDRADERREPSPREPVPETRPLHREDKDLLTNPPPPAAAPPAAAPPAQTLQRATPEDFPSPSVEPGLESRTQTTAADLRTARREQPLPRASARTQTFLVIVASICLLLGAVGGFLLGIQGSNTREPEVVTTHRPPVLRVMGPEGTKLTVGDREFTLGPSGETRITLSAGEPTTVRAELEGHAPLEAQYTLDENSEKALQLEWATLRSRD